MKIFKDIFEKASNATSKLSKDEMKAIADRQVEVAEDFIENLQRVDISKQRQEQISSVLSITLSECGLLGKNEATVELALKLKEVISMFYCAGFTDGFFEQLPKIMVDLRVGDSKTPIDNNPKIQ